MTVTTEQIERARINHHGSAETASDSNSSNDGQQDEYGTNTPPSPVMWTARILSGLVVGALVSVVLYFGLQPNEPVSFEYDLKTDEVRQVGHQWALPVDVKNVGTKAAERVLTRVALTGPGGDSIQSVSLEYPLVGAKETLQGEVWFEYDPRLYTPRVTVTSLAVP